MVNIKLRSNKAAVIAFFMLLIAVPYQVNAFVFLLPVIASKAGGDSDSDNTMRASDTLKLLVKNTAIAEMTEGTGYAFFEANGGAVGIHPEHGKLEGNWNVDSDGKMCITWSYPSGSITNCAKVTELGSGKYQWGNREFTISQGDVKNLN